ncbi:Glyoxalase/Bleomycin resistance protein/Dihydroxybiphenyl dioxygenase [Stachybotrys elegans]|uniref:Glyoxalase/Bleomycin resistance protein/Dihydroxybiphenyl dioxygenase n=1 Tax=Stachybotrys elegans TaxID=80388 RepID=A0A8K0SX47_9HYPO|nr:Glyoxalase/Bleomycin resistance protein/Dihydroxybiphenyl dioxygenase [Stachybotrys elegans]
MADECKITQALGKICWFEIPVSNVSRAKQFYTDVMGWEMLAEAPPPDKSPIKSMHFFRKGEGFNGAFLEVESDHHLRVYDEAKPRAIPVLATFCVRDCDATLNLISELGGKTILPKTEIGNNMGYYAQFMDSEGNWMGIWSMS